MPACSGRAPARWEDEVALTCPSGLSANRVHTVCHSLAERVPLRITLSRPNDLNQV